MTSMPTSYESSTTTTTNTAGGGGDIRFRPEYIRTLPGILKIVEVVLDIIVFICSSVWPWFEHHGGPWVQFVSMSAFITTLVIFFFYLFGIVYRFPLFWPLIVLSIITFICACVWWWPGSHFVEFVSMSAFLSTLIALVLHLMNLISRFPGPWILIEFIYYCVFTLFFLIAAIVCAVKGDWHSSIGAAAFFAFAATAIYAVDTFLQFRAWRSGETQMTTATTTSHTVTTTHTSATVETKEAY